MAAPLSPHPLLSVVIATYNRANDLDRAIQSVLAEPGDFFEVIIGDDSSPDHTPAVAQAHQEDARLRYYRNPTNLGMRDNVLKICGEARGDYIFILTDDDYLLPGALTKVARLIQAHPEAGYILSHLPTVDERTGRVVDRHHTYAANRLIPAGLPDMVHVVRSAWVLSRQVLKRRLIDWTTWERFKGNIFFPIIVAGRLLLRAPGYYLADELVIHTWFNQVFWNAFGPNALEIQFNLARDAYQCMRAILHDYPETPEVARAIQRWENNAFRSYLYLPAQGFYDLTRSLGLKTALRKLRQAYPLNAARRWELCLFPVKIPFVRAWVNLKVILRHLPVPLVAAFQSFRNRITSSAA